MTGEHDICWLNTLALLTKGPILEQGAFVGRSTTAIAAAVKDQNVNDRIFITNDLFPASWRDVDNKAEPAIRVPYFFRTSPNDASYVEEYIHDHIELTMSKRSFEGSFAKVLDSPGGMLHALYANLALNGFNKYVTITAGESYPILPYAMVWSDAAHTREEIQKNAPRWLEVCKAQPDKVVAFIFHDISMSGRQATIGRIRQVFIGAGHQILDHTHNGHKEYLPRYARGYVTALYAIEVLCSK